MKSKILKIVKLVILIAIFIAVIFGISYFTSKIKIERKEAYVNFVNSVIPDLEKENFKLVNGRENIAKIIQAVQTYYNACYNNNIEMVKNMLNDEYVKNMNINIEDVILYNNKQRSNSFTVGNDIVYDVGENIYFVVVKDSKEYGYYVGVILNEAKAKYSIFIDGIYNHDDIKEYVRYEKNNE